MLQALLPLAKRDSLAVMVPVASSIRRMPHLEAFCQSLAGADIANPDATGRKKREHGFPMGQDCTSAHEGSPGLTILDPSVFLARACLAAALEDFVRGLGTVTCQEGDASPRQS